MIFNSVFLIPISQPCIEASNSTFQPSNRLKYDSKIKFVFLIFDYISSFYFQQPMLDHIFKKTVQGYLVPVTDLLIRNTPSDSIFHLNLHQKENGKFDVTLVTF